MRPILERLCAALVPAGVGAVLLWAGLRGLGVDRLLAGVEWRGGRPVALFGLIPLANPIVPTVPLMPVPALLGITLAYQTLFHAFCVWILVVPWRRGSVTLPAGAGG